MKCVYFLLLIVVLQGSVAKKRTKRSNTLPTPEIGALILNKDNTAKIMWYQIDRDLDAILGFLVNIWEVRGKNVHKTTYVHGKPVDVIETEEAKLDPNVIPGEPPREVQVPGSDSTEVTFSGIKPNVQYHIRVQVYSSDSRGPHSAAVGLKVKA